MADLDINQALSKEFQKISSAVLLERVVDYLTSIGRGKDAADVSFVDAKTTEFYQSNYDLLITDFTYGNVNTSMRDLVAHEEIYINSSPDDPLEATFSYEYSRQDGQSFKFTEGLKVGTKAGVKAKLPIVGEANVEVSAEVSFSAEQSFTTTETSRWNFSEKLTVKPSTSVKVTGLIRIAKLDAPFTCKVKVLDGNAFVELGLKGNKGYSQMVMPIKAIMSDEERSFVLSGNLNGSEAAETFVKVVPVNLPVLA
ncbi:MAG TPA: ETX/MTX2 family pore-forming toxin [Beijerinckia sp.]|jgi:hypothetical protein|nr:ETX/MTX2 family pore-forming toxin [Beijerinckia sp.]